VIYLNGQYLEDYLPVEEALESRHEFPSTKFVTYRDNKGKLVNMAPIGEPAYPECVVSPLFSSPYYSNKSIPQDGDLIAESYDEILKYLKANN